MGFIYFINDGKRGYIGQANQNITDPKRLKTHYNAAVFGTVKDNKELVELIRKKGWCNLQVSYYTDAENYGIPLDIYQTIAQKWENKNKNEDQFKRDVAEILFINCYRRTLASCNKDPGGQERFVLKDSYFQEFANKFDANSRIGKAIRNNTHIEMWSKFSTDADTQNDILYTLLYPERYILQNVFQHEVLPQIWNAQEMAQLIKKLIVSNITNNRKQIEKNVNEVVSKYVLNKVRTLANSWTKELNGTGYSINVDSIRYKKVVHSVEKIILDFYQSCLPFDRTKGKKRTRTSVLIRRQAENKSKIEEQSAGFSIASDSFIISVTSKFGFATGKIKNLNISAATNYDAGAAIIKHITQQSFSNQYDTMVKNGDLDWKNNTKMAELKKRYILYSFIIKHWAYFYDEQMNIKTSKSHYGPVVRIKWLNSDRTGVELSRTGGNDPIIFQTATVEWDWYLKRITNNREELMKFY